jgi:hypothetical protein
VTIITPPAALPLGSAKWRVRDAAQVNRSLWTGTRKAVGLPGAQLWTVSGNFAPQIGMSEAIPWKAFFFKLRGVQNSFPVIAVEAQQTSASNPTVASGAIDGASVPLTGLPVSSTVLLAGQMLTVTLPSGHKRLAGLTADLVSNGSGAGTATLNIELGETPAMGAAVEIQWPFGLMALTGDTYGWDVGKAIEHGFVLDAEEAR